MARHDLDLRMGIDEKLKNAEKDTGALSYSVDKHNIYIDALKEDKTTTERQQLDARRSYGLKYPDEEFYEMNRAEGSQLGDHAITFGYNNIASGDNSMAIGYYNAPSDDYIFSIGNGNEDERSNAISVSKDGTTIINGETTIKDNLTVDGETVINGPTVINNTIYAIESSSTEENPVPKELVTLEKTEQLIEKTQKAIMQDVKDIADAIITDVWYRGATPPSTVKQAKLLWIRYDGTSIYQNGILYYFNPALMTDTLTDAQVADPNNWIMMSAMYT